MGFTQHSQCAHVTDWTNSVCLGVYRLGLYFTFKKLTFSRLCVGAICECISPCPPLNSVRPPCSLFMRRGRSRGRAGSGGRVRGEGYSGGGYRGRGSFCSHRAFTGQRLQNNTRLIHLQTRFQKSSGYVKKNAFPCDETTYTIVYCLVSQ